jgi:CDP-diacylglycerol---glycerol-3-phosphate 3-phosphatidyltransferase
MNDIVSRPPTADLVISIVATSLFAILIVAYAIRSAVIGRVRHRRIEAAGTSVFLNKSIQEMVYWVLDPLIDFIAALRITPNMVTLGSLVPATGAAVALGFGWFGLAGVLSILAAFGDIIDGLLARKTGLSSGAGEVVDAAVDRYSELLFFGGLVYYYRTHDQCLFIVLAALAGAFMVSYATAKAEAMGVEPPRGAMRRGERAAYLMTGSSLTPICATIFAGSPSLALRELPIILSLTVVAVVANISVVQRLAAVAATLRAQEQAAARKAAAEFDPEDGIATKPDVPVGSI